MLAVSRKCAAEAVVVYLDLQAPPTMRFALFFTPTGRCDSRPAAKNQNDDRSKI